MSFGEIIKELIPYASLAGSVIAIITAITKESRYRKKEKAEQETKENELAELEARRWDDTNEALKCLLRNDILEIYYHYKPQKRISRFAFDNVGFMHYQYKKRHGNSFIDTVFEQMKTWEIYED